jgi:hypothetical protein
MNYKQEGQLMEKKGRNAGKRYEKPLSLHSMKFEDAIKSMFRDPSMQFSAKPKKGAKRDK